jgi:enoyl-CoA hydratase/carnithine racemase
MPAPYTSDVITVGIDEGVALVTFNRPQSMNALNTQLRNDLIGLTRELDADDAVNAIVFTGAGDKAFCAGADLKERGTRTTGDMYRERRFYRARWVSVIAGMVKPTIAAINGHCLGGGLELALQCDMRLASENARFGMPEVTLGFFPGSGATQRLPRAIGLQKAKELILTGRRFDAHEAAILGLVLRVVPHEQLMPDAMALARKIAENPREAVMQAKLAMNASQETPLAAGLQFENETWLGCMLSDTWKEKVAAFNKG